MKIYSKILSALFLLLLAVMAGCDDEDDITPRSELVAIAGDDKTINVNEEILLDGSGSYDKANRSFTYSWSVKTKPQGSIATLNPADSVKTTFIPDVAGLYVIHLRINRDNQFSLDDLVLTVTADEPNVPATVILHENIVENTTLNDIFEDPSQPDYLVTNDIDVQADLTIMPGVTIVFEENKGLQIISGAIRANGTSNNGIVFRGLNDSPAYWKGIVIHSNSDLNEFEYVAIKQAGSSVFSETGIQANVTLAGTSFSGAALKVSHTSFGEGGGYGLYVQGLSSLHQFSSNTFFNNTAAAAYIPAGQLHKLDGAGFSEDNGLETGGSVLEEIGVAWKKLQNGSYLVTSDILIKAGVTVEPGASFKMKTGVTIAITDNGYLNSSGSEAARITFTSEEQTYWNGLFFNSHNANNKLTYCEISNAGLNTIADAVHQANIVVGNNGILKAENSIIKNGLGYGVVTKHSDHVNGDVILINTFDNLQKGKIFPLINEPDQPAVEGVWLDQWSFNQAITNTAENFYNKENGTWFGGAANPWDMNSPGFGLHIGESGDFTWTVAEHSPMTGCESYSAEFITGTATISSNTISFDQDYWRSKFINSCDETQNVDINVTPSEILLPYEITKMYDVFRGEEYWELKLTNPDNSTFSLYRR